MDSREKREDGGEKRKGCSKAEPMRCFRVATGQARNDSLKTREGGNGQTVSFNASRYEERPPRYNLDTLVLDRHPRLTGKLSNRIQVGDEVARVAPRTRFGSASLVPRLIARASHFNFSPSIIAPTSPPAFSRFPITDLSYPRLFVWLLMMGRVEMGWRAR